MAGIALNALLLEDEALISIELEMVLEEAGFEVATAMSCLEANRWLDSHVPDVVIVDIELRDGVCTEVVDRLVKAKIPFVVYTSDSPSLHFDGPFAQGTWVGKPAGDTELVQAVKAAQPSG